MPTSAGLREPSSRARRLGKIASRPIFGGTSPCRRPSCCAPFHQDRPLWEGAPRVARRPPPSGLQRPGTPRYLLCLQDRLGRCLRKIRHKMGRALAAAEFRAYVPDTQFGGVPGKGADMAGQAIRTFAAFAVQEKLSCA
eukprot:4951376-Alexandrium_andersonii.AAC.1